MVRAGAWLPGAILALLVIGAANAQDWKLYRSDAGRFQADMPGTPNLAVMYADYKIA